MEDGPAKRTRSSVNPDKRTSTRTPLKGEVLNFDSETELDSFKTPLNSPIKSKSQRKGSRTPSGQVLTSSVKDIRNFFLQESQVNRSEETARSNTLVSEQEPRKRYVPVNNRSLTHDELNIASAISTEAELSKQTELLGAISLSASVKQTKRPTSVKWLQFPSLDELNMASNDEKELCFHTNKHGSRR